jgi:hypothetical protein
MIYQGYSFSVLHWNQILCDDVIHIGGGGGGGGGGAGGPPRYIAKCG